MHMGTQAHGRYNAPMAQSSLLSDLIDLHAALRADRAIEMDRKKQRDRQIGTALQGDRGQPSKQLRGWLARVELPHWQRDGHAGTQLYHVVGLILAALGLATGWGLAQAVLHYTGDAPINIINALVVLILPQLVLLVFWCIALAPVRLPLISSLQSAVRFLNPGRMARLLARRFSAAGGRSLGVIWDPENAVALAPAARWLASFWSQLFSVFFNVGVLLAVFYLISFSDLAFGWSTTLALSNESFHAMVRVLSWPWHGLVPEAVPSAALVEASRFYRLDGAATAQQAAVLGGWWPFLVAAIVCYGLLPRLLTLLISWQRLYHHLRHALTRLPGAPEVLARMNSPLVSTAALRPEPAPEVDADALPAREHATGPKTACTLVAWSGSITDLAPLRARLLELGIEPLDLVHAGGAQRMEQDQAVLGALCRSRDQGVALVVKAWEPPLLEFVDFVQQVRDRCTRGQPVIVLLWGGEAAVDQRDIEVWQLTLRPLKDPDLHVEAIP